MEQKKSPKANLELRRGEIFLMSLLLVISCLYTAISWNLSFGDDTDVVDLEEIIDDIDFDKLKRNQDMVAAISETDLETDVTNIKPAEVDVQQKSEPTASKLIIGDGDGEVDEATVEEVKPISIEQDLTKPEGFKAIEQLPEFPGGSSAFMKWITEKIKYPEYCRKNRISGKVVVSFLVEKDGSVENVKIEKADNAVLGNLVLKVMNGMPQWKPGRTDGQPCRAMVAVPINFEI